MKKYKYIIVGGGMAAASAVEGIREVDQEGEIALFSKESNFPYNRPPLTKGLWQDGSPEVEDIWRKTREYESVDFYLDTAVNRIDRDEKLIVDEQSNRFKYDKLLLATGGQPITLPSDPEGKNVLYFRTLQDYYDLSDDLENIQKIGVIGGGFIGAELAASLKKNGKDVVMIFPEEAVGSLRYPDQIAELSTQKFRAEGIEIMAGELVTDVSLSGSKYIITTESGKTISVDKVVAGLGIQPNVALAEEAGLEVEDGISVDKSLRTSDVNIWAAGDVASFYNPHLERRIRVEHAENAKKMGKLAGKNMAGKQQPYNTLPLFYSDMFNLGFEAVGKLDPDMNVVIDWKKKPEKGVVYYLDEKKGSVEGVLLWNYWGKVDEARDLIGSEEHFQAVDLINRI